MVAYLNIACRCLDDLIAEQFESLCAQLSRVGKIELCQVYEGIPRTKPRIVRGDGLFRFLSESSQLYNSKQHASVQFEVPLPSREPITVYAELFGRAYRDGFNALCHSPIVVSFEQRELLGPRREALKGALPESTYFPLLDYIWDLYVGRSSFWSQIVPQPSDAQKPQIQAALDKYIAFISDDFKNLFSLVCGIGGAHDDTARIHTAAVYSSGSWPSSFDCNLIYHRERHEFRQDLGRLFAQHIWGTYPSPTMVGDWTLHELKSSERFQRDGEPRRDWINKLLKDGNAGSHAELFSLQRDCLDLIGKDNVERILASDWVPSAMCLERIERETIVTVDNFGGDSLALTALPYEDVGLSPAWLIMFEDALSYLG